LILATGEVTRQRWIGTEQRNTTDTNTRLRETGSALAEAAVAIALISLVALAAAKYAGFRTAVQVCNAHTAWRNATTSAAGHAYDPPCEALVVIQHGFPDGYGGG
jgi:hypothetical protein